MKSQGQSTSVQVAKYSASLTSRDDSRGIKMLNSGKYVNATVLNNHPHFKDTHVTCISDELFAQQRPDNHASGSSKYLLQICRRPKKDGSMRSAAVLAEGQKRMRAPARGHVMKGPKWAGAQCSHHVRLITGDGATFYLANAPLSVRFFAFPISFLNQHRIPLRGETLRHVSGRRRRKRSYAGGRQPDLGDDLPCQRHKNIQIPVAGNALRQRQGRASFTQSFQRNFEDGMRQWCTARGVREPVRGAMLVVTHSIMRYAV